MDFILPCITFILFFICVQILKLLIQNRLEEFLEGLKIIWENKDWIWKNRKNLF